MEVIVCVKQITGTGAPPTGGGSPQTARDRLMERFRETAGNAVKARGTSRKPLRPAAEAGGR
jgi:hypothetical protein